MSDLAEKAAVAEVKKTKNNIPDAVHALAADIDKLIKVDPSTSTSGDGEVSIYSQVLPEDLTPDGVARVRLQDALFGQAIMLSAGRKHIEALAGTEAPQMRGTYDMLGGMQASVVTNRRDEYRPGPNATSTDNVVYYGTTRSELVIDVGTKKSTDSIGRTLRSIGAEVLGSTN